MVSVGLDYSHQVLHLLTAFCFIFAIPKDFYFTILWVPSLWPVFLQFLQQVYSMTIPIHQMIFNLYEDEDMLIWQNSDFIHVRKLNSIEMHLFKTWCEGV